MGIEEKTQYAPEGWREELDRQTLFCLANFLPGQALERWWVYGLLNDNDSRSNYRHTFGSRFEYDGRFPAPSYGDLRSQRAMLQYLHNQGVYLKLLKWGGFRATRHKLPYLDWRALKRRSVAHRSQDGTDGH